MAVVGRDGGGVDDNATLAVLAGSFFCNGGGGKADHVEGAVEVDADGFREKVQAVRAFAADDALGRGYACAVDERVEVAKGAKREIGSGLRVAFIGNVGEGEASRCAELGGQGLASCRVGVGDDDEAAFSSEQAGRGCAQAGRATGNEEDVFAICMGEAGSYPSRAQHIIASASVIIGCGYSEAKALNPVSSGAPITQLSEEETLFRDSVRKFARDEVAPLVRRMDEEQHLDAALLSKLFKLGLMGIEIPEEFGGSRGSFFDAVLAVEMLSAVDPAVALVVDVQNTLAASALLGWGTPEQKLKYLPRLAADTVGAYALSEAGSGSDAFALQTRAEKRGGEYVLSGRKLWISNAKEAGLFIVFATVDASAGYKGITAFLVEKDTPGFAMGRKEDKLGIRASSTCEVILDECAIPAAQVLGEAGKGYRIAMETLNGGRIGIGAQMLGLAEGAWDHAVKARQGAQAIR